MPEEKSQSTVLEAQVAPSPTPYGERYAYAHRRVGAAMREYRS